jgi:hypothetical protein
MNLYAYVGNDPVNGIDPTGMCTGSRLTNSDGTCASSGGWTTGLSGIAYGQAKDRFINNLKTALQTSGRGDDDSEDRSNSRQDGNFDNVDYREEDRKGGHTHIHVGKNDQQLVRELNKRRLPFLAVGQFGTFPSPGSANRLINAVIDRNAAAIFEWANGRGRKTKRFTSRFGSATGREAFRRNYRQKPRIRITYSAAVVLRRDDDRRNGFTVLTAFPFNPR